MGTDGLPMFWTGSSDALNMQQGGSSRPPSRKDRRKARVDRQKLIIILVGLPGRGKTFLCNKLMCYLNWCAMRLLHGPWHGLHLALAGPLI